MQSHLQYVGFGDLSVLDGSFKAAPHLGKLTRRTASICAHGVCIVIHLLVIHQASHERSYALIHCILK
jgi:hypothetical protein